MPRLEVDSVGSVGLVKDISSHRLDPRAWTDARNIQFNNLGAHRVKGYSRPAGSTPIVPYKVLPFRPSEVAYWLLAGQTKVYQFDGRSYTNITRQSAGVDVDYTGIPSNRWNVGVFHGSAILNNGVDIPQFWAYPFGITKLQNMPAWPVSHTAKVLRNFKNFLVGLYVGDGTQFYPHRVMWSHQAEPGTMPTSWDHTDPTVDAGRTDLSETSDSLVDCLSLRDSNIIYKETSTYRMTPNRNQFIFDFPLVFRAVGMLTQDCAVEYNGRHIVLTSNDLVIHDGVSAVESIIEGKAREWLFANIDRQHYHTTFLFLHETKKEVWICFPLSGSEWPNRALVVSLKSAEWAIRDLPEIASLAFGPLVESTGSDSWDDDEVGTWESAESPWNPPPSSGHFLSMMLGAAPVASKLYKIDDSPQNDGVNFLSYLERIDVPLGPEQGGSIVPDFSRSKLVQRIYPVIKAPLGTAFKVSYGGRRGLSDQVQWQDPKLFRVGIDKKIDPWFRTHALAIKFSTEAPVEWTMEGYSVEYEMGGLE